MCVPCPRRSARSAQGEGTPPSPRFPRRARSPRSRSQLPGFSRRLEPIRRKRVLPRPYAPQPPPGRSAPGKPTVHDTAHRRFPPRPAAQGRSAAATARRLPSPHVFATRRRGMIAQKAPRQKARKGAFPRSLSRASAARAGAAPLRPLRQHMPDSKRLFTEHAQSRRIPGPAEPAACARPFRPPRLALPKPHGLPAPGTRLPLPQKGARPAALRPEPPSAFRTPNNETGLFFPPVLDSRGKTDIA